MANFVFNVAKGKLGQYVANAQGNTPAGTILRAIPLSQSGTQAQGEDLTTMAAIEADVNFAEQTNASWGRKTLTSVTWTVDNTNNRGAGDAADVVWAAPTAGNNTTGLVIVYDSGGASADSALIPLVHLDMAVTADGNQVTFQFNATGFVTAT